jgi:hypothetical protein
MFVYSRIGLNVLVANGGIGSMVFVRGCQVLLTGLTLRCV